jgi:hypothetical protein
MSYLTVLDKELLESLVRIQPLKAEGEPAKPIVMSYCTHDCRDVCEGNCWSWMTENCGSGCTSTCGGGCGPTYNFGASNY